MSDKAIKSSKRVLDPIDRVSEVLFGLIAETSKSFEQARRYADLTAFEFEESPGGGRVAVQNTKSALSHAERVFVPLTSLASDQIWNEWRSSHRPPELSRVNYETPSRSELRMQQSTPPRNTSTTRISQLSLGDGTKRCFRPLQTAAAVRSSLKLLPKFNILDES